MIAQLEGILRRKGPDAVVVMTGGVGFRVFVSRQALDRLPPEGERVLLEIHTQVRADAILLFGFPDQTEREVFEALLSVEGIGPKAAISVLSGIDPRELARAVCAADMARLTSIPGVGKKRAERMILDLRDKLQPLAQAGPAEAQGQVSPLEDLRSALSNLGFRGGEVERALASLRDHAGAEQRLEVLLPEALRLLRG